MVLRRKGDGVAGSLEARCSLYEYAAQRLRERVLNATPGERLSEWGLSREFGISRSWMRTCVSELVTEGLLERAAGRGTFVTQKVARLNTIRICSGSHNSRFGVQDAALEAVRRRFPRCHLRPMPWSTSPGDVRAIISHAVPAQTRWQQPVDPVLERYPEIGPHQYRREALDIFRHGGRLWALPILYSAAVLFYNPEHFDRARVAYPDADWCWDDLIDAARALASAGQGDALALSDRPRLYSILAWSHGAEFPDDPLGEWDLSNAACRHAARLYARIEALASDNDWHDAAQAFADGGPAMLMHSGMLPTSVEGAPPDGMAVSPMPRGETRVTWAMAEGVGLGRGCPNVDMAAALVRELVRREGQQTLYDAGLRCPARSDVGAGQVERELFHTEMRNARVTYHVSDMAVRSVVQTQLRRLTDPSDAEEFCEHTSELVNGVAGAAHGRSLAAV